MLGIIPLLGTTLKKKTLALEYRKGTGAIRIARVLVGFVEAKSLLGDLKWRIGRYVYTFLPSDDMFL